MRPPPAPPPRLVSISASGRYVAIRQVGGVDVVDALGTAPRASLATSSPADFACVGQALWVVADGALRRFSLDGGGEEPSQPFERGRGRLIPARGEHADTALWWGPSPALIRVLDDSIAIDELEAADGAVAAPLAGRHLVIAEASRLKLRDAGGRDLADAAIPGGRARGLTPLFGGRALAALIRDGGADSVIVLRQTGALIHHISVPSVSRWAVADIRGLAVIITENDELVALDLRYGRPIGRVEAPVATEDLAIDAAGRYAVLAGFPGDRDALAVHHVSYAELFGGASTPERSQSEAGREDEGAPSTRTESAPRATQNGASPRALSELIEAPKELPAPATTGPAESDDTGDGDEGVPPLPLMALHPVDADTAGAEAPDAALAHLDARLALAAARAARAIARAWHSGRLSISADTDHPFEREVLALVGSHARAAARQLAELEARLADAETRVAQVEARARAEGARLPADALVREFGLSRTASEILLAVAAPALRGEVARLYGILANDEARSACDAHLLELLLVGSAGASAHDIASELQPGAPLVRHGLVRVHPTSLGQPIFHPLTVDAVLLPRLRGEPLAGLGPGSATRIRQADRALEELSLPSGLCRDLVVAAARKPERPLRLVLKGRPGSGRHAVLAALAARAGRPLALIDCEVLSGKGGNLADGLRAEIRRAALRGAIPCIDGLEVVITEGGEAVRDVFRGHPGPVFLRLPRETKPPLDPGYAELEVPPMSEGQRLGFWREALARRGLRAAKDDELAARFRIGAGTIEAVIDAVCTRRAAEPAPAEDASEALDEAARQHIDARLGAVATRVERLARWEQVALPDDVIDSIREFIGRVRHRRTVYESWGFDAKMSTSRGLSALFYGPPGTGKSMVAGLIARELALDLYRVDLARITSKWIGETEKNLAQIFDAAEDGQAIILFDEADSLFAKRTEVKSSVDRYANLEVNYLLQRLDTFEGIAILTTNQEGSLDTAFKRRLSLRLAFPFPDEEMRVKLWAAHIPPEVPTAGRFDFDDLARRFPLSGGYIRNSALRAAFLAAQEDAALSQAHLERAVHLEYREMGKLSPGGKME